MGHLRKIEKKASSFVFSCFCDLLMPIFRRRIGLNVKTIDETLREVFEQRKSLIRFGDGELLLLIGSGGPEFQKPNRVLQQELKELLEDFKRNRGGVLLCMPGILSNRGREYKMVSFAKHYWFGFLRKNLLQLEMLFAQAGDVEFGDTNLTRPYMDTMDREYAGTVFSRIKKELKGKNVLIVEGRYSRFGVGNDILSETKSVRRILGPEVNAYDRIDILLERAKMETDVDVVILSLGPSAKILAYNLTKCGFWCLDLGHLDIEYEWFKMGATNKVVVKNKYVNETSAKFYSDGVMNFDYESQIIYSCE